MKGNHGRKKTKDSFICEQCGKSFPNSQYAKLKRFCSLKCWHSTKEYLDMVSKNGKINIGEKHYNWKGGITPIQNKIRNSLEYKLWREAVFERDNYTCIWCNIKSGKGKHIELNADHIKPFALFPELRFAIDNGRTLCRECHETTDTFGGKVQST